MIKRTTMKTTFKPMAFIEMLQNDMEKYEINKQTGIVEYVRKLDTDCPVPYGFFHNTLHEDGDSTDVFIINAGQSLCGASLPVTIIGAFLCSDHGIQDDKLVAVYLKEFCDPAEISSNLAKIESYLNKYKKGFKVRKFVDKHFATSLIKKDLRRYSDNLKCE